MRISIGTAQLGMKYGIANSSNDNLTLNFDKVLEFMSANNLKDIDTAFSYGNAHEYLTNYDLSNFNISSKVMINTNDDLNYFRSNISNDVSDFIKRCNLNKIDTLFIHNPDIISHPNFDQYYLILNDLKENNLISKLGISIYDHDLLKKYLDDFLFDTIQLPVNPFDSRISDHNQYKYFTDRGIKLQARSIYLQGLLLLPKNKLNNFFDTWSELFEKWFNLQIASNLSPQMLCLNYLKNKNFLDSFVIGIDNLEQLKESIELYNKDHIEIDYSDLNSLDEDLINPSKWQLNL